MTDRHNHLIVALEDDYRDDALEGLMNSIRGFRGVAAVKLGDPVAGDDWMLKSQIRWELRDTLITEIERALK
jgi:hypothetical protein